MQGCLLACGCCNPRGALLLLTTVHMLGRVSAAALLAIWLLHGCLGSSTPPVHLKYQATGKSPEILAVYEAWFGEPNHINVGYSSHDTGKIKDQIDAAKKLGISAFVVDWYGDRDTYVDQSYGLVQAQAAKHHFHVAVMYDETAQEDGATDEAIADLTMFHDTYLSPKSPGHDAYLTYQGRPVIFIFPHGHFTDWDKVRAVVNQWNPAPLLIQENLPRQFAQDFDGFYPWINSGPKGWAPDGSHWGELYLDDFYQNMAARYADSVIVGGAWAQFDDSKASWGLNRHISARCGQTLHDTFNLWHKFIPAGQVIPYMLVETWNDYEEGSAIEPGLPTCGGEAPPASLKDEESTAATPQ